MLRITRKIKNLFSEETEFDPDDYQKLLKDSHKENKAFNDKVISAASVAAIPLLINLSDKLNFSFTYIYWMFIASMILFLVVFIYQLVNNIIALKGCDKGLNYNYEASNECFNKTDKNEIAIYVLFFIAIIISFIMFIINLNHKIDTEKSTKTKIKQEVKMEQKTLKANNSMTPHASVRPQIEKRSQTPPKVTRPPQEKKGK